MGNGVFKEEDEKPKRKIDLSVRPQLTTEYFVKVAFDTKMPIDTRLSAMQNLEDRKENDPLKILVYDVNTKIRRMAMYCLKELGEVDYLKKVKDELQKQVKELDKPETGIGKRRVQGMLEQSVLANRMIDRQLEDHPALMDPNLNERARTGKRQELRDQMAKGIDWPSFGDPAADLEQKRKFAGAIIEDIDGVNRDKTNVEKQGLFSSKD